MTTNAQPKLSENNIDEVLKAMTLEEKAKLLVGGANNFFGANAVVGGEADLVAGAAGTSPAIPRLGIPATVLTDGPAGVRINPTRKGTDKTYYATAFPIGSCLASTWNTELVSKVGEAIGNETKEYRCDVILGPLYPGCTEPRGWRFSQALRRKLSGDRSYGCRRTCQPACCPRTLPPWF